MKTTKFTVALQVKTRQYTFPMDMLRYDCCYPASTDDADNIYSACNSGYDPDIKITLYSMAKPTPKRWESFGWRVIK